ncbi:sugar phosphate isomerase/epimerase family protein [Hufsiella ginkgonis]|uniref:TIM barrel protein n=1 Tax=Hufsiella ginkgonis TaxID=2695274 RepID=A0A7K1XUY0_9SPHI|nr:sugar phosphate isomerase/epimerase family protein [Hufsiella ginkgonis]MXV14607.1 TIM barrel protein [Hufsiella ginkgonis]
MPHTRRHLLKSLTLGTAAAVLHEPLAASVLPAKPKMSPFIFSLNMSTIRGHNLGFTRELETASKAGFRSVEIWIDSLQAYLQQGGTLAEARKRVSDLGLTIESAIGFARWMVDDAPTREKAVAQLRREMEMLAAIGCKRTAAPPSGATGLPLIPLNVVAERYAAILNLGEQLGVTPQLELWGGSKNMNKVSDVLYAASASERKSARILLDVFHLYKGGSNISSLHCVGKNALEIFHVNDYPAGIGPAKISEPDRIYPGDGIAPIKEILTILKNPEKPLVLSFEVFNKSYYTQDPVLVAKTALAKMKAVAYSV